MNSQDKTSTALPVGLLILLTATNALNFVDRNLLSSFANFLKPELHLTDTQFGLLTGLVFLIFYAVAGLFMGMLADLTHRPRLVAAAIAMWSLLTAVSGAAKGFVSLALPRALIGIGESALSPAAISLLADRVNRTRMGLATAIYYMGVPLGTGIGLLVAGYLGPALGWRNCFYAIGAVGILLSLAFLFVREPRVVQTSEVEKRPSLASQISHLVEALKRSPSLAATMAGGVALHISVGAAQFDQLWFVAERGFDKAEIARLAGYITVIAGVSGNLFGGLVGDWWQKNMKSGRPMLMACLMVVLIPAAVLYRLSSPGSALFYVGMGIGVFQLAAFYGPTFSTVQDLAPVRARATVTAFYILCLNVIGLGIGNTGMGIVVDHLRSIGEPQPYTIAIIIFICISVLAVPAFYLAGIWSKRDRASLEDAGAQA
jgi:MFS family permease